MKRIAIGAIVGGVVVFVWDGFSHMVLLKGVGFSPLPNEAAVLFPTSFILAEGIDQAVGWALAGLAIAKVVAPPMRPVA